MKFYCFLIFAVNLIVVECVHDYDLVEEDLKSGSIDGDYIIGALFPIHRNFDDDDFQCNTINDYDGIQIAEAAFFAVDLINRNENILPNVTLGIDIRDYCYSFEVAVQQSKKLIDKSVSRSEETEDSSSAQKGIKSPLIGIIGPGDGLASLEVQSILKCFSIVQIGYSEPLTDFVHDMIELYPYFFSVTPGTLKMTEAIIDVLIAENWTCVSVIHSTSDLFGLKDVTQFHKLASERGVCIADVIPDYMIINAPEEKCAELSKNISNIIPSYDKVDVIVCYCSPELANVLFRVIKNNNRSDSANRFIVVGGDDWLSRYSREPVREVRVSLKQPYIKEFDNYFLNLSDNTNKRNPWFTEFWEERFECELDPHEISGYSKCSGEKSLATDYKQNPKVPYVIESVFVFAHALHNMLEKDGENVHSGKSSMKDAFNESSFRAHVQKVKFDFFGKSVQFGPDRILNNILKYNFHNFKRLENGSYDNSEGKYSNQKNKSVINKNLNQIKSSCREPCSPRHAKVLKKDKCCWNCVPYEPLESLIDSTQCVSCLYGFKSNSDKTRCIPITMVRINWYDASILALLLFSSLSIILAMFSFYIFIKNDHTPVVKSSTKELCYIIFVGMIIANLTPFTMLLVPSFMNCVAVRTLPPLGFTFMYAALLVKTNRIARILANSKKKFPNLYPKFLSLRAQIVFTIVLITIEVLICSYSLYKYSLEPVNVFREKNNSYHGIKMCSLREDMMFEIFAFIAVLILICTYYAVKTRNLPENFNEAKYIGFAMYSTILTDVFFGLIYFGSEVKILAINLCISVNTFIVFIFIVAPKLYVILRMPEKNTTAHFITTTNNCCSMANFQESHERKPRSAKNRLEEESEISMATLTPEICVSPSLSLFDNMENSLIIF